MRSTKTNGSKPEVAGIPISHPEQIIDTTSGSTKIDFAEFYDDIVEFLPHLQDRPASLLRAPKKSGN